MACDCQSPKTGFLFTRQYCEKCGEKMMKHDWTVKHPLDAVESALVDASNALNNVDDDVAEHIQYSRIDNAIDDALQLVQAQIRADLDPPDPRD